MRTPLPEKQYDVVPSILFEGISTTTLNVEASLDAIITYLAELSEVVDRIGRHLAKLPVDNPEERHLTLKEKLLGAMPNKKPFKHYSGDSGDAEWNRGYDKGYNAALTDVEAIINRLIP